MTRLIGARCKRSNVFSRSILIAHLLLGNRDCQYAFFTIHDNPSNSTSTYNYKRMSLFGINTKSLQILITDKYLFLNILCW